MAAPSFLGRPYNDLSMKIGVFTALLSQLPLVQVLEKLQSLGIHTVELGTGNYPGDPHCPLSMLTDRKALREFKLKLEDRGFSISALSCHGNPLHPNPALAKAYQETSRKTVRLAEKLGVPVVIDFPDVPAIAIARGIPTGSPVRGRPNTWSCWTGSGRRKLRPIGPGTPSSQKITASKIAIEMHPGFVVYSPETLLKLRAIAGPRIGCNYDPSHMFWQGIDPIPGHSRSGRFHFSRPRQGHPDLPANLPRTGVLDTKKYTDERNRSWIFRTVGYGHGQGWWKEFISTLRMYGYDYVLSIEHEDSLLSPEEGLTKAAAFLNEIVIKENRLKLGGFTGGFKVIQARRSDKSRNFAGVMPEYFLNSAQKWL
jgi:sugar phosphate isomerase/epimerase